MMWSKFLQLQLLISHNVTYKIVSFLAENSDIQAIGTVKIKIIYQ